MVKSFSFAALLAAPLLASAAVVPNRERELANGVKLNSFKPRALRPRSADVATLNYAQLERHQTGSSKAARLLGTAGQPTSNATAGLDDTDGVQYLVDIAWGSQTFKSIVDTGSSDTWLVSSNFQCEDQNGNSVAATQCGFGPGYSGTLKSVPGEIFNISYGDGEFLTGTFGTTPVTIAGITVPSQQVALATSAYWEGEGVASGLTGFAYPAITAAYTSSGQQEEYDPLVTTIFKDNLSPSTFSLALMRGTDGGYLAFGGVPPISGIGSTYTSTPIQVLSASFGSSSSELTFYTITPDAIVEGTSSKKNTQQWIVDSGTTLVYAPSAVAKAVNALYSPKATLDTEYGIYTVSCTAKAPKFGVTIAGTTFYADAQDMLDTASTDQINGKCVTAVQDGGSGPYILGDAWMKSVVAVFDVGASEMRFATHTY